MASKEYRLIQEENTIHKVFPHLRDEDLNYSKRRQFLGGIGYLTLTLSLSANALLMILYFSRQPYEMSNKTIFASLERNKQVAWTDDSDFASHNRTIWDQAWETLNPDMGFVVIGDELGLRHGLHESQRWPWDSSKGLYLLEGYHGLHCLTILRKSLTEMHDQKPQTQHFAHINHCLDSLRQEIICNADDTPRYSGLGQKVGTGKGQYRMCKDWKKLEEWAKGHSACYKYKPGVETSEGGIPLDRFKYCPDGSEPWKNFSGEK